MGGRGMSEGMTKGELMAALVNDCQKDLGIERLPTEAELFKWWGVTPTMLRKEGIPVPEGLEPVTPKE